MGGQCWSWASAAWPIGGCRLNLLGPPGGPIGGKPCPGGALCGHPSTKHASTSSRAGCASKRGERGWRVCMRVWCQAIGGYALRPGGPPAGQAPIARALGASVAECGGWAGEGGSRRLRRCRGGHRAPHVRESCQTPVDSRLPAAERIVRLCEARRAKEGEAREKFPAQGKGPGKGWVFVHSRETATCLPKPHPANPSSSSPSRHRSPARQRGARAGRDLDPRRLPAPLLSRIMIATISILILILIVVVVVPPPAPPAVSGAGIVGCCAGRRARRRNSRILALRRRRQPQPPQPPPQLRPRPRPPRRRPSRARQAGIRWPPHRRQRASRVVMAAAEAPSRNQHRAPGGPRRPPTRGRRPGVEPRRRPSPAYKGARGASALDSRVDARPVKPGPGEGTCSVGTALARGLGWQVKPTSCSCVRFTAGGWRSSAPP
eukprot:scaffold603_cov404-Prasinococcus_capsulatus_cf.AAC.14